MHYCRQPFSQMPHQQGSVSKTMVFNSSSTMKSIRIPGVRERAHAHAFFPELFRFDKPPAKALSTRE